MQYTYAIWWLKRDLRLEDNPVLIRALQNARYLLPVYIFEPEWLDASDCSGFHLEAVLQALEDLQRRLRRLGAPLLVTQGALPEVWLRLRQFYPFEAVFSHQETGVDWTYRRDIQLKRWFCQQGIDWIEITQKCLQRTVANIEHPI